MRVSRLNVALCGAAAALLGMALADGVGAQAPVAPQSGSGRTFTAPLRGNQEVPAVTTQTKGSFKLTANQALTEAKFELRVTKGKRVTQAHLHCAPAGLNGPIVAFLAGFHELGWDVNGEWISNTTLTDANIKPTTPGSCPAAISSLADLIAQAKLGNIYANVHTIANSGGEVRGQLKHKH